MSLRTRFVIFCIGLLLIGLASLAVLLAALTGRIESSPTGIAVFSILGVSATGLGAALVTQRKRMPSK